MKQRVVSFNVNYGSLLDMNVHVLTPLVFLPISRFNACYENGQKRLGWYLSTPKLRDTSSKPWRNVGALACQLKTYLQVSTFTKMHIEGSHWWNARKEVPGYIETEGHGFKYLKNFPSVNCLFIMKLLTMLDFSAKKAKIVSSRRLFCLPQRSDPNLDHSQNRTFIYHDQEYRTEIFSHTSEKSQTAHLLLCSPHRWRS